MDGSPQPPPSALNRGEDYKKLYAIALDNKPHFDLEDGTFALAILSHEKDVTNCESGDFVWIKVKSVSSTRGTRFSKMGYLADEVHIVEALHDEVKGILFQKIWNPSRAPNWKLRTRKYPPGSSTRSLEC